MRSPFSEYVWKVLRVLLFRSFRFYSREVSGKRTSCFLLVIEVRRGVLSEFAVYDATRRDVSTFYLGIFILYYREPVNFFIDLYCRKKFCQYMLHFFVAASKIRSEKSNPTHHCDQAAFVSRKTVKKAVGAQTSGGRAFSPRGRRLRTDHHSVPRTKCQRCCFVSSFWEKVHLV